MFKFDVLHLRIEFPRGYPISLPSTGGFGVYQGPAEVLSEKTRLVAQNAFVATNGSQGDQWTLELRATQARAGSSYEISWIPPRKERLKMSD